MRPSDTVSPVCPEPLPVGFDLDAGACDSAESALAVALRWVGQDS